MVSRLLHELTQQTLLGFGEGRLPHVERPDCAQHSADDGIPAPIKNAPAVLRVLRRHSLLFPSESIASTEPFNPPVSLIGSEATRSAKLRPALVVARRGLGVSSRSLRLHRRSAHRSGQWPATKYRLRNAAGA